MMHAQPLAHQTATRDTPRAPANSGAVLVPVELLAADVTATALAVWVLLAEHVRGDRPEAWPTRDTLMRRLGRAGADGRTVSRAVAELAAAGLLDVTRRHTAGRTRNTYRPRALITADDGRRWVELTAQHRAAVQVGAITPTELRALARWLHAAGRNGWTRDTLARHAADYGTSVRTATRARATLVGAGLLETRTDPGRPTITAAPGRLPAPAIAPQTHAKSVPSTPDKSVPLPTPKVSPEVTPVEATKDEVTARVLAAGAVTALTREAVTPTPPAPRPKDSFADPEPEQPPAGAVLAALPAAYRAQPQWVRARLLALIVGALGDYGPAALVAAVDRHDRPEQNACWTFRRAVAELAADVLAGCCRECGRDDRRTICPTCNPDRMTLTVAELDALTAAGYAL